MRQKWCMDCDGTYISWFWRKNEIYIHAHKFFPPPHPSHSLWLELFSFVYAFSCSIYCTNNVVARERWEGGRQKTGKIKMEFSDDITAWYLLLTSKRFMASNEYIPSGGITIFIFISGRERDTWKLNHKNWVHPFTMLLSCKWFCGWRWWWWRNKAQLNEI